MTSEAVRLKEHLRRVGEAKKASHREATDAHLALPAGERLARGVQLSDLMLRLHREAHLGMALPVAADLEAEAWTRVHRHLKRLQRRGDTTDG